MTPDKAFNAEVRARLADLTGADQGPFRIKNISTGPKWPSLTRAEQVEAIARTMIPKPGFDIVDGVAWRR